MVWNKTKSPTANETTPNYTHNTLFVHEWTVTENQDTLVLKNYYKMSRVEDHAISSHWTGFYTCICMCSWKWRMAQHYVLLNNFFAPCQTTYSFMFYMSSCMGVFVARARVVFIQEINATGNPNIHLQNEICWIHGWTILTKILNFCSVAMIKMIFIKYKI